MNSSETLPPVSNDDHDGDGAELWPTAGPTKGLRIRLPIAIAALAVVGLVGAAAGASLKNPSTSSAVQAGAVGGNRATGANGGAGVNGASGAAGATAAAGGGRLLGPGGGVVGTVSNVDGNTITVTQRDGTTATVVVPSGTAISKTVAGSLSDLTAGTTIAVRSTTADGKTTAESITINPANGGGPGPGAFADPPPQSGATNGSN